MKVHSLNTIFKFNPHEKDFGMGLHTDANTDELTRFGQLL